MCGCNSNCDSLNTGTLPTGLTGATGATGSAGLYGGFSGDWLFDVTNGGAPADTFLRFNGAGVTANVTSITVEKTGPSSVDYTNFLASLSNNSKYGYVRVFKKSDSTKFWMGQITLVADSGTYYTLTVSYFSASNAATANVFSASDSVVLTFSPSGAGSSSVLSNNTTDVVTSGGGTDALMSYVIPANTLKTNEDVIEIDASYTMSATSQNKNLSFTLNGSNFITKFAAAPVANTIELAIGTKSAKVKISITRKSSLAVYIDVNVFLGDDAYLSTRGFIFNEGTGAGYAVADLSTNTLTFACFGSNYDATSNTQTITQNQLLVKYFNK